MNKSIKGSGYATKIYKIYKNTETKVVVMYKELFKRIIEASHTESLTFFVGAGVSKLSGAPSWSQLIDKFSDEIGRMKKERYSNEEYLSIPQMYYYSINQDDDKYYEFINKCFGNEEFAPNEIHKMLFALNPHAFITTNFDDLLERSASENCQTFKVVASDNEISEINGNRFILKLHGDLKHRNIVLKEEDYLNYSENFKLVETLLKSIFATNTVVFIGYGLNDYNIKLILNWTKTLLKEKFNKPIFIYTDDAELSKNELRYHESKGLSVVDYRNCTDTAPNDFINKYKSILKAINNSSYFSIKGKDEKEAFELLYDLLLPLDAMKALRIQDIKKKIYNKTIIESNGVIDISNGENILFKYFSTINDLNSEDKKRLKIDTVQKYKTIVSVLSKAQIKWIYSSNYKYNKIADSNFVFADPWCVQFDYIKIQNFVNRDYDDYHDNYRKAYYFAKLYRYKEAYELFIKVALDAYHANDFLLHFLAQANRYVLYKAMKEVNNTLMYYNMFDLDDLIEEQIEHIFERLPIKFQNKYSCFKDIASVNMLYENSYYSFKESMQLQNSIDGNVQVLEFTSENAVLSRIHQNLHFFLGNGLYMEEFSEFKNTIQNLMSTLVYKYSVQTKKSIYDGFFGEISNEIYFDYISFYCFIEYFDIKELNMLFSKHSIKVLDFKDIKIIESCVQKLCTGYDAITQKTEQKIEILPIELKIKKCLNLLRYINISQELVNFLCSFIFKDEFNEIYISDKILFLDAQLKIRKRYSEITASIIENKLIFYIDNHIQAIINNKSFDLLSNSSKINYPCLIYYICADDCIKSRRLAFRVTKIIKNSYLPLKNEVISYYYSSLSVFQQKSVIKWIRDRLSKEFDFNDFLFLANHNIKIDQKTIIALKIFLKKKMTSLKKGTFIKTNPVFNRYGELNIVGYFCRIGSLKRKDFSSFLNYSPIFDLFYKFDKYNFEKFDSILLLQLQEKMLQMLSENKTVKRQIRKRLAKSINSSELRDGELRKLSAILTQYFC